jgi:hypothetical protein
MIFEHKMLREASLMHFRDRLFGVLLWCSVVGVGIWIGGTLYMMLVINPIWSASPAAVEAFFGGTSFTDHILNFFGPLWIVPRYLPILLALIVGWKHQPQRYYLLAAVAVFVFVVVFTNAYIYSLNTMLMAPHATVGRSPSEIEALVDKWLFADRLRLLIGSVGYLCLLKAFRLPVRDGTVRLESTNVAVGRRVCDDR